MTDASGVQVRFTGAVMPGRQAIRAFLTYEFILPTVGRAGRQDRLMRPECDPLVAAVSFIFLSATRGERGRRRPRQTQAGLPKKPARTSLSTVSISRAQQAALGFPLAVAVGIQLLCHFADIAVYALLCTDHQQFHGPRVETSRSGR